MTDVARAFGLSTEPSCYCEVDESMALAIAVQVLHRDLAYHSEVIPADDAIELVSVFFEHCRGPSGRFFSNGEISLNRAASWMPATEATFDSGVLIVGSDRSGCLWVEDED